VEDARRERDQLLHMKLAALGRTLAATGNQAAARDTLERAASLGWSTELYRSLAEVQLALGDTAAAVRAYAHVATDARNPGALADSVRGRFPRFADQRRWAGWIREAQVELRERVLAQGTRRPIGGRVRLTDDTGRERVLSDLVGGRPTVVAFWSRYCAPSIAALPELQAAADQLERAGVRVVAITREEPSPELTAWMAQKGVHLPVYHDVHGEASRALQPFGTPDQFVLDASGVIRFEHGAVKDLTTRVGVLRP
jgi:thiol-disulfide isomerase/thioredoxin